PGSVQTTFTVRVQSPLAGALAIENTVTSSVGICPDCTVVNPTTSELQTTKAIATVNGAAANNQTQIPPGAEVSYQITTTNHGGTAGKTILTETVPANASFVGPTDTEGWTCVPAAGTESATCTKEEEVGHTRSATASVQTTFTVRVQSPLGGALAIENTVKSSVGVCPTCTVVNPTTSELVTTKAIATVNGAAANNQTQIPPGAEVSYQITTTNHGGTAAKTTLTQTVPAHTSFVGPTGATGWTCTLAGSPSTAEVATCTKEVEVGPAGSANASVQSLFTVKVQSPLGGAFAIENTVKSSVGTRPLHDALPISTSELVTTKAIATVNGAAANAQTQ